MGNDMKCQFGESEEEIIERIFLALPFRHLEAAEIYKDLNETYQENERLSATITKGATMHLPKTYLNFDLSKITPYLEKNIMRDDNICKKIHMEYFNNLLLMDNNVLLINTILLCISKGEKEEKVKFLSELYQRGTLLIDRDLFRLYIEDVIKANSCLCVNSFKELFGDKSCLRLNEVYNDFRRKKLCDFILSNFTIAFNDVYKDEKIPANDSIPIEENSNNNKNDKFINKLYDLILPSLKGDFIRTWLSDEYERDKSSFLGNECCGSNTNY